MWDLLLILIIVFLCVLFILILINFYNDKLFQPSCSINWHPPTYYEDFFIGPVNTWYIPFNEKKSCEEKDKNRPVILYCHGNNSNISYREYPYIIAQYFNFDLVLFDYQGYGKSEGKPSQNNICNDGQLVYDWLINVAKYDPEQIIIWGESLGGAVAIDLASKNPCSCLILFSTFSSIKSAICEHHIYPKSVKLISTVSSFFINNLISRRYIKKVEAPVLILHSKEDDVIPISNARDLYRNIKHKNKELIVIEGTHTHPEMTNVQVKQLYNFCCNNYKFNLKIKELTDEEIYKMYSEFRRAAESCIQCK